MSISMDVEETFDRAQGPFMLKPLRKVVEGNFLNLTEYQQKPTAGIIPDGKRLNAFFPTLGIRRDVPSHYGHSASPRQCWPTQQGKKRKSEPYAPPREPAPVEPSPW